MPLFYCIHCGQYIDADDELVGLEGDCPACKRLITVPGLRKVTPKPPAVADAARTPPATTVTAVSAPAVSAVAPPEPPAPVIEKEPPRLPLPVEPAAVLKKEPILAVTGAGIPVQAALPEMQVSLREAEPPPSPVPEEPITAVLQEPSAPAAPAEDSSGAATSNLLPLTRDGLPPEQDPTSAPQWQPRRVVVDEFWTKRRSLDMAYLPIPVIGMTWLVGAALWQVGLMLGSGPGSAMRDGCRDSMLFLLGSFLASLQIVGVMALMVGMFIVSVSPMLKRGTSISLVPAFCAAALMLGIVLLVTGICFCTQGIPLLAPALNHVIRAL